MNTYRIRLVERITSEGFVDFTVTDVHSPQEAAQVVADAHGRAQAAGSAYVKLPDGQVEVLEPDQIVVRVTEFLLLGADGASSHIPMPQGPTRTQ